MAGWARSRLVPQPVRELPAELQEEPEQGVESTLVPSVLPQVPRREQGAAVLPPQVQCRE